MGETGSYGNRKQRHKEMGASILSFLYHLIILSPSCSSSVIMITLSSSFFKNELSAEDPGEQNMIGPATFLPSSTFLFFFVSPAASLDHHHRRRRHPFILTVIFSINTTVPPPSSALITPPTPTSGEFPEQSDSTAKGEITTSPSTLLHFIITFFFFFFFLSTSQRHCRRISFSRKTQTRETELEESCTVDCRSYWNLRRESSICHHRAQFSNHHRPCSL